MKWFKKVIWALLALLIMAAVFIWFWLRSSQPEYEGGVVLDELIAPAEIHFDEYGIPHIYAQNRHDLYVAFGYVHAQERLFQMELLRRAGSGRLAEVLGPDLVKTDMLFRTLGLTEYAAESAQLMEQHKGDSLYTDMMAYLDGVNQYIQQGNTPPEFTILGIPKEPFTTRDIFLVTGAMAFSFSQAQKTDFILDDINNRWGEKYLRDLAVWHHEEESYIPLHYGRSLEDSIMKKPAFRPQKKSTKAPSKPSVSRTAKSEKGSRSPVQLAQLMDEVQRTLPFAPLNGSNSWAVAGERTASGKVLFCNDTHIGYLLPQTWYEAHLNCPGFELYGHFMAGVPFALTGYNKQLTWGLTMLLNDDMDFYREKQNPDDATQLWVNDHWERCEVRSYTLAVKGAPDTTFTVRVSRHGPVVNDIFKTGEQEQPISMWWTYTRLPNRTLEAFYGFNHAHNFAEFENYLPLIHAPGLSLNYGDMKGNIAWWGCASLIQRPAHVNPMLLLDGASGLDEPLGYAPFTENPRSINPPHGYIYSANDWPETADGQWLPGYYKPQYRADRIRKLLRSKKDWRAEEMKAVLTDHVNEKDSALYSEMWRVVESHPLFSAWQKDVSHVLVNQLASWNGSYEPEMNQPVLYNAWLYNVLEMALSDEMGRESFDLFMTGHQVQRAWGQLMYNDSSQWWNDVRSTATDSSRLTIAQSALKPLNGWSYKKFADEKRADIMMAALVRSVEQLQQKFGRDPAVWKWKKVCTLEMQHPFGRVAALRPFFNIGPQEVYGGNETILCSGFTLDSTGYYKVYYGSQMRFLADFANEYVVKNITPAGQSGHLMSTHYSDQAKAYRTLQFREVNLEEAALRKMKKLLLRPA